MRLLVLTLEPHANAAVLACCRRLPPAPVPQPHQFKSAGFGTALTLALSQGAQGEREPHAIRNWSPFGERFLPLESFSSASGSEAAEGNRGGRWAGEKA